MKTNPASADYCFRSKKPKREEEEKNLNLRLQSWDDGRKEIRDGKQVAGLFCALNFEVKQNSKVQTVRRIDGKLKRCYVRAVQTVDMRSLFAKVILMQRLCKCSCQASGKRGVVDTTGVNVGNSSVNCSRKASFEDARSCSVVFSSREIHTAQRKIMLKTTGFRNR